MLILGWVELSLHLWVGLSRVRKTRPTFNSVCKRPWIHGQRRHIHLVLALERVVTCRDVMQWERTEGAAESKECERSGVALETLTLKQSNLPTDLERLQHNSVPLTVSAVRYSLSVNGLTL